MTLATDVYTPERVRFLLREYQRHAQNARLPERAESLSTGPTGYDQAAWTATATMYADLERGLQRIPYQWAQVAFMVHAVGNTFWVQALLGWWRLTGKTKKHELPATWNQVVEDWFGLGAGEARSISDMAVQRLCREMNEVREE